MYRHEIKLIVKQILCIKLVKYWYKYTEIHRQQNVKKNAELILLWLQLFTRGDQTQFSHHDFACTEYYAKLDIGSVSHQIVTTR